MISLVVVLLLLILVSLWLGFYALVKQQGRILLRLDQLERDAKHGPRAESAITEISEAEGVLVGTPFPEFKYPDLNGEEVSLAEFRGRRVLLVHWSFTCGFCELIASELAALDNKLAEENVELVLLSYGDVTANRKGATEHNLRCPILLIKDGETPEPFAHRGTPVAYLLDEEGRVDAPLALGAEGVIGLVRAIAAEEGPSPSFAGIATGQAESQAEQSQAKTSYGHRVKVPGLRGEIGLGDVIKRITSAVGIKPCVGCERRAALLNRWVSFSGVMGSGLKAGTTAPPFRLPDVNGRMVSLQEYRGRRVLLVFTDPQCGPCDELAPDLVQLHEEHANNGLAVIVVGRGDADENRSKAQRHGYKFPFVVQPKWDLSKDYGTFATPAAFLIGEDGAIVKDVAFGTEPILTLARRGVAVQGAVK